VTAVADPDPGRASAAASAIPGALALRDPLELIGHVDAELIASPGALRAGQTLARVAAAGAPREAAVARRRRSRAGRRTAAPSATGWRPRVGGSCAASIPAASHRSASSPPARAAARRWRTRGRGVTSGPGATDAPVVFRSAIHDLDLVPWLLDAPIPEASRRAPAAPSSTADGLSDPFLLLLRTADGALSTVQVFLNARYGYDMRCEVVCETGTVSIAEPHRVAVRAGLAESTGIPEDFRPRFAEAYRLELQERVSALNDGRAPTLASVEDGATATRTAAAAVGSMRSGGARARAEGAA